MTTLPNTLRPATTPGAYIAVLGDAEALKGAFETDSQVTLNGKYEGERVYLGYRHQTHNLDADGARMETTGLDRMIGGHEKFPGVTIAAYCIDTTRLDDAPKVANAVAQLKNAALRSTMATEARAQAEDERLSREAD